MGPVTFYWNSVNSVAGYWISIGTTGPGSGNTYNVGTATQYTLTMVPATGGRIYVRLGTNSQWGQAYNDYVYDAPPLPPINPGTGGGNGGNNGGATGTGSGGSGGAGFGGQGNGNGNANGGGGNSNDWLLPTWGNCIGYSPDGDPDSYSYGNWLVVNSCSMPLNVTMFDGSSSFAVQVGPGDSQDSTFSDQDSISSPYVCPSYASPWRGDSTPDNLIGVDGPNENYWCVPG